MNIVKSINQYNNEFVYFLEPIRNNIINNGNFIKIIYSTPLITFNGIYLYINLTNTSTEKYFNKHKCVFDTNTHKNIIDQIQQIEISLLNKYITNKTPQYKIYDQIKNGNIKIFTTLSGDKISNDFLLKIAGIWETDNEYGLTYKFINL